MNHCVLSYFSDCRKGHIHIFSLSKWLKDKKKPIITIEVINNTVTQIAGKNNNEPSPKFKTIINDWAKENKLKLNC